MTRDERLKKDISMKFSDQNHNRLGEALHRMTPRARVSGDGLEIGGHKPYFGLRWEMQTLETAELGFVSRIRNSGATLRIYRQTELWE